MANVTDDEIIQVIYKCIDELNEELSDDDKLIKNQGTCLFDGSNSLGSMQLVNFIVNLEGKIQVKTGLNISLTQDDYTSLEKGPFRTVQSTKNYISVLINR